VCPFKRYCDLLCRKRYARAEVQFCGTFLTVGSNKDGVCLAFTIIVQVPYLFHSFHTPAYFLTGENFSYWFLSSSMTMDSMFSVDDVRRLVAAFPPSSTLPLLPTVQNDGFVNARSLREQLRSITDNGQ